MKRGLGFTMSVGVLFVVVLTLLVFGKPVDSSHIETEQVRATLITCIKDDGYAVSIAVRTVGDGTMTAEIIDGSVESQFLPSVTSIRQSEKGVEIEWRVEETTPTTMTILGAHIVEVCSN